MGLAELAQNLTVTAINTVGNIAEEITLIQKGEMTRIDGVLSTSTTEISLKAVFMNLDQKSLNFFGQDLMHQATLDGSERLVLMPGKNLAIDPKNGDTITRESGEIWEIEICKASPVNALWKAIVKKQ